MSIRLYGDGGNYNSLSVDELIARNLNQWNGWLCSAGVRGLYIDYDGNLWRCNTASSKMPKINGEELDKVNLLKAQGVKNPDMSKVYGKKLKSTYENKLAHWGFLGNIEESFELPGDWVPCIFKNCGCGADVMLPKAKSSLDIKKLVITNLSNSITIQSDESVFPVASESTTFIPYQILWDISRFCNYDCSYCWPGVHNKVIPEKNLQHLIDVSNKIIDRWSKGNTIRWCFGGGEPTLYPEFLEFLQHLKSRNQWTLVTSNGSRDLNYWKKLINYLDGVNLSAHFESLNEEKFIKNIKEISKKKGIFLEVKLMAPPESIERALQFKQKIEGFCRTSLVPIRRKTDSSLVEYSKEQLTILSNQKI